MAHLHQHEGEAAIAPAAHNAIGFPATRAELTPLDAMPSAASRSAFA
jgi:hypothetical protein